MNNSLAEVHPELVSEWSEKNLPLTPDDITFGSNKKVWWKGACGHELQTSVAENYGGQKVSMAVNRIPGEKMYIDWVGDQPELLTNTETDEIKKVYIFATTLGVSSLIYAEAFPNEKLPCFIEGCFNI